MLQVKTIEPPVKQANEGSGRVAGSAVWNVPNQLSAARLAMAVGCFVSLSWEAYWLALGFFLIATATDWLDGYWARRYNLITQLGRILDPFADKVVVCGAFVYLASIPESRVSAWVAVVVMAREMLVTALRSFVEHAGGDFSAKWSGKWKMAFQCAAIIGSLLLLASGAVSPALDMAVRITIWLAVALTIYSGWVYIRLAAQLMQK